MAPVPPLAPSPLAPRHDHLIVCGDDALAARVVEELATTYGEEVTVLLRSQEAGHGPRIARLPGVRLIERAQLDDEAFSAAHVQSARALALLRQDDLGNVHAALRAQELNPKVRLVLAIFNSSLGDRIRSFFRDCAVLSGSSMSAPSFVAAALGEPAPSHVRVAGRTMYVTRRGSVDAPHVMCALSSTRDPFAPGLLPSPEDRAELVLAVADGAPRDPLSRQRPPRLRALAGLARGLLWHRLGAAIGILAGMLIAGFVLLYTASRFSFGNAVYLTVLDAAGAAVSDPALSAPEKVAQVLLTLAGMALLPVATAAVVANRLTGSPHGRERPVSGHVIVAGLGNVGTRIAGQLHDLGVDVVCVDKNERAQGVALARHLGLKVVIGETDREETLLAAGITTCQALVSVTDSDSVNLEMALHARALASEARIVLRLSDDDLAARVQRTAGNTVSRSVPYLAAPAFAAAMLEHQVLRTIPVGRHVLLLADIEVGAGSELAGRPVEQVHQPGQVRAIALHPAGGHKVDWSLRPGRLVAAGDRLYVLATRAGLRQILARCQAAAADERGLADTV